ncbi:T9SS type A sorting domain-containing protein [Winogradskyella tangerina]|uniref:T9SS type A sorting domain-containing protein n=1 Tax=Winogradskyella tangerina TaxID=2023240 RepID=UPI000DBE9BE1|nr:T9SS type A sorting domain-containing protein [Winogradskyella tangerina]
MKKITLMLICLIGYTAYGQLNVNENFDASLPGTWSGGYSYTTELPCSGAGAIRENMWSSNTSNTLTSPNYAAISNGTDLDISFDYAILDYPAGFGDPPGPATVAGWGSAEVQYSTDAGMNWTTVLTIDDLNHVVQEACANMMVTIPAASLPNGSDIQLQILNTWVAGDYYFYVDNFVAQQDLGCTAAVIDSTTVVDDCGNNQFTIDVVVSAVNDGTQLNDGTNTYALSVGTVIAGPYPTGTAVTLSVEHSVAACDFDLSEQQYDCPPSNDSCANAVPLTAGAVYGDNPVDGTLIGATDSGFTNSCGGTATNDVWYTVVVPAAGDITIETAADVATGTTGNDTALEVYTSDSDCTGSLTSIGCDDDGAATGAYSFLELTGLTPGQTLYIRLWGFGDDEFEPYSISAYSATLGVDDLDDTTSFTYYPNPVKNTLSLSAQNNIENVTMYNMLGQEVLRANPNNVDSDIDMSGLQTGTYFVKVTIANITKTIRVIKQ